MQYLRAHPDSSRTVLVYGMANGLHYLHSQKPAIIHGDLKPENVLISDQGEAQLCDFGLSRALNELSTGAQTTSTMLGYTIRYSSYEVIIEEMKTVFSDVYAFGCTSIQVLFDKHPFSGIKNDIRRILSQCCEPDHDKRPSISSVLQDLDRARSMTVYSPLHGDRPGIPSSSDEVVLPPTIAIRVSNGAASPSTISSAAATGWNMPDASDHPGSPAVSPELRTSLMCQALGLSDAYTLALWFSGVIGIDSSVVTDPYVSLEGLVPFMPAGIPSPYDSYSAFQMLVEWGLDPQVAAAMVTQSLEESEDLIIYCFSRVSKMQYIYDCTSVDIAHSLITKSPHGCVTSAIIALRGIVDHSRTSNSHDVYFNEAQNELNSVVKSGRSLTEAEAIAALYLVSYWLFQGGWQSGKGGGSGWLEVLNVACVWYVRHSGILNGGPEPLKTIYKLSPEGRFAARMIMWMDIFSGITLLRHHDFLPSIVNLEHNRYHDERTTMETHDREFACSSFILRSYMLRTRLLSIDCSTQPVSALFTELSMESSSSAYPFTYGTPNMPDKYSTSEIFRQAALLYLSTVTSGYSPSLRHTQDTIVALKIAVEAVPLDMVNRVDRSLVFPIFLAGCMTDDLNLRAFFGGRLRSLGDAVGNHITALQLMEAVWCMRDSTGEAVAWRDVMNDMKFELLMV
ncbi:uncharacterized protein EI90DRAFT_3036066 [Cantharellus anzutake]|uniref:uncharacterized protein n=1 Tax=Cantharellus anzutake TaxID=1750568 RepID=UPI0019077DFA|nr:uncharacterized protein EI90DRAFT_3036066 [Cantharellus anzutake]KAF8340584.1 hypothetical protein EI90DRAFT_3036066 [Cantharellus anzutake]